MCACSLERTPRRRAIPIGACTVVCDTLLVDVALVRLAVRRYDAAPLPLGRLDPMGHQSTGVVRIGLYGAVRAQRPLVFRCRLSLVRCSTELSDDRAPLAGVDEHHPRALGRFVDEHSVVAARGRVHVCCVRDATARGMQPACRAARDMARIVASAR